MKEELVIEELKYFINYFFGITFEEDLDSFKEEIKKLLMDYKKLLNRNRYMESTEKYYGSYKNNIAIPAGMNPEEIRQIMFEHGQIY